MKPKISKRYEHGGILCEHRNTAIAKAWRSSVEHLTNDTKNIVIAQWQNGHVSLIITLDQSEEIKEQFGY